MADIDSQRSRGAGPGEKNRGENRQQQKKSRDKSQEKKKSKWVRKKSHDRTGGAKNEIRGKIVCVRNGEGSTARWGRH